MQDAVEAYLFPGLCRPFLNLAGPQLVLLIILNCVHDTVHRGDDQDRENYYQQIHFGKYAVPIVVKHPLHPTEIMS